MSQSTTATLERPRPARLTQTLAPMMTAAAVLAVAHLPLLLPRDGRLCYGLQGFTSKVASRVLDYVPVLHYLDGNTFEIGSRSYLVDKACSGINSLYSTLFVTLFCILYFGLFTAAMWVR